MSTDLKAGLNVKQGTPLLLTVAATGSGLSYQWYKNDVAIPNATNATYKVDSTIINVDDATYYCTITNPCGTVTSVHCIVTLTQFILLGVNDAQPGEFILNQNNPNPFNATSAINFLLPEVSHARLVVTDIYGRELATLLDKVMPAGISTININAADLNLASGVYFYTLTVNSKSDTRTMVIVK